MKDGFSLVDGVSCYNGRNGCYIGVGDKQLGIIQDNRLLIKPVPSAIGLIPRTPMERPFIGARPMLQIEDIDDKVMIRDLVNTIYDQLPKRKGII